MLKEAIHGVLNRLGYDIHKITPVNNNNGKYHLSKTDIKEAEDALKRMEIVAPGSFAINRIYLSDVRIIFYKKMLELATELNIDLNRKDILDLGTCLGYFPYLVKKAFPNSEVYGWDHVKQYIDQALAMAPDIHFDVHDIENDTPTRFDVIYCTQVLEHLVKPDDAIRRMKALLKPNGSLVLTVPDGRRDTQGANQLYEDGRSYEGHINFWSRESWEIFLRQTFPEVDMKFFAFDNDIGVHMQLR